MSCFPLEGLEKFGNKVYTMTQYHESMVDDFIHRSPLWLPIASIEKAPQESKLAGARCVKAKITSAFRLIIRSIR